MTRTATASLMAILLLGAAVAPANAQFPPPRGTTVDQLIAAARAADLLDGETSADGKRLVVGHAPSGLVCRFPADGDQNLLLVQLPPRQRGQDITCSWIEGKTGITIRAAPAEGRTAAQWMEAELQEINEPPSRVTPYEGPPRSALPDGVVEGSIVNYGLVHRKAVFESRGWLIQLDIAYFPDNAAEGRQIDEQVLRELAADARAAR